MNTPFNIYEDSLRRKAYISTERLQHLDTTLGVVGGA